MSGNQPPKERPLKPLTLRQKLLLAQGEIGAIKKDSANPFFKSKYFDINSLLAEVKPVLNKYGLIILQPLVTWDQKNALETLIYDADDGEAMLVSRMFLPDIADMQKLGSAITYTRRYALQAMLALEAEDDDANTASGKSAPATGQHFPRKSAPSVDIDSSPFP